MSNAAAVAIVLVFWAAAFVVSLALSIYVLRRGVEPLRYELARIADAIELQLDVDDDTLD
jgi:hypothetical protein